MDIERLLNSLTIVKGYKFNNADITFDEKNIINNPVILEGDGFSGNHYNINLTGQCYIMDGGDENGKIQMKGQLKTLPKCRHDGHKIKKENKANKFCIRPESIKETDYIGNKSITAADFTALIDSTDNDNKTISIMPVVMENEKSESSLYISGELKGNFTGTIYGKITQRHNAESISFVSAFDKSCQSAIHGSLLARNYEQRWIYAHHTVTYHTRFIMQYLLECYCNILYEQERSDFLEHFSERTGNFIFTKPEDKQDGNPDIDTAFRTVINRLAEKIPDVSDGDPGILENLEAHLRNLGKNDNNSECLENIRNLTARLPKDYDLSKKIINIYCDYEKDNKLDNKSLFELLGWIVAVQNISEKADKPEYTRAQRIINDFIKLIEKLVKNTRLSTKDKDYIKFLSGHEQTKNRFLDKQMQYMVDVIAMPEKKKICGQVYCQSNDEDLYAFYRTKMWELDDKGACTAHEKEFLHNAKSYFFRNFPSCMWKTHAEFIHLFKSWSDEEIQKVFSFFKNYRIPVDTKSRNNNEESYMRDYFVLRVDKDGPVKPEISPDMKLFFEPLTKAPYHISRLVFVTQLIKTKRLNPYTTYFNFNDAALRLCDIRSEDGEKEESKRDEKFFYFYYERDEKFESKLEKHEIIQILKHLRGIIKNWGPLSDDPAAEKRPEN